MGYTLPPCHCRTASLLHQPSGQVVSGFDAPDRCISAAAGVLFFQLLSDAVSGRKGKRLSRIPGRSGLKFHAQQR
ncbi:hypothetical protein ASZ90_009565 [hydrocarbon metagenome]|uniref:Uncharacterized protein n=1 Tax=hydrocarbon metagenome TaxID=938273 RepID=A0A0W8FIF6_9ZZZZ